MMGVAAYQKVNQTQDSFEGLVDSLSRGGLNEAQLEAIRLFCCVALRHTDKAGIRAAESFSELFQPVIMVNPEIRDSGITKETLLLLILESIGYNMNGLDQEWLLQYRSTFRDAASKKFDMILTVAVTIISMKEEDYRKFELLHIKQNRSAENQSRFDLVSALLEKEEDINIFFDWLQVSGCSSYQQKLREYCKRHGIKVSRQLETRHCCFIVVVLSILCSLLIVIIFNLWFVPSIDVNVRDPQNETYPIGLSTTIKLECYDTSITDEVAVTAVTLNSAAIYTIPEDDIRTYPLVLPYINLSICISDSPIHYQPIPVSYNTCYEPIYIARDGGTMNYSIDLVNRNPDRVSCAMRLFVFSFHSDYLNYTNAARDPQDDPPRFMYSSLCVGSNGTHSFGVTLPRESLYYFVLAVVNHTTVNVSVSGSISVYSNAARYRGDECHLTLSNRSCSIMINPKKRRYNSNVGHLCLFGNSTYAYQGKVNLFATFITKKKYLQKYWIPSIPLGFFTLFFLILLIFVIIFYLQEFCKRKNRIAEARQNTRDEVKKESKECLQLDKSKGCTSYESINT